MTTNDPAPTSTSATASAELPALRDLLARVASGDLDPAEAARLLDEDPSAPQVDRGAQAPVVSAAPAPAVAGVVIRAGGVKLRVIADPSVATAVAIGPHAARQDGATLHIDAPSGDGYRTTDAPGFLGWVPAVWTGGRGERVTVRVNPRLPLTIEATACSVDVAGLDADLALTAVSSSIKVNDHRGCVRGSATMCSVHIVGAIRGPGSFTCELGSLNLRLAPGSDVAATITGEMGSVKVAGRKAEGSGDGTQRQTVVAGAGTTTYDVAVRMGSATVVAS